MLPNSEKPTTKLKRASNRPTLLGIPAMKDAMSECLPMKYDCILTTEKGMMLDAKVVSHLSIEDWCMLKGYNLFSLEGTDVANKNERTVIGG